MAENTITENKDTQKAEKQGTESGSLLKVMSNSLSKVSSKKKDVASAISDNNTLAPNQIPPSLDKFENNLIRKRKFHDL